MSVETDNLIVKQTMQIEALQQEIGELRPALDKIYMKLICIGGPLNDNVQQYNKQQLRLFFDIQRIIEEAGTGELCQECGAPKG